MSDETGSPEVANSALALLIAIQRVMELVATIEDITVHERWAIAYLDQFARDVAQGAFASLTPRAAMKDDLQ